MGSGWDCIHCCCGRVKNSDGVWSDNNSQSVCFCPSCSVMWCLTNGLSQLDGGAFLNRRVVWSQRDCTRSLEILQGGSRDWDRLLSMNASADGENWWWPHNKIRFFCMCFGVFHWTIAHIWPARHDSPISHWSIVFRHIHIGWLRSQ